MGCAHAFSIHRPHCSPLLVDAISCSCNARQAVHRQSAAGLAVMLLLLGLGRSMFEHYHTNSQRGDT